MRWPFKQRRPEADVRAFRDPKTGQVTLRLNGQLALPPSWDEPIIQLDVRLEAPLTEEAAISLRDQLLHLIPVSIHID